MSESHATAYRELRLRVSEVIRQADASACEQPAPATPGWRVHDVVAHLVGVPDDVVNGRLEGIASDPWTQAQVDKRADCSTADLLAEWEANGPAFEALLAGARRDRGSGALRRRDARARPSPRARRARRSRERRDRGGVGMDRRRPHARR